MTYCKFMGGKGGILYDTNTTLIPRVGETVQLADKQYTVTRVLTIYSTASDWVLVTVGP